MPKQKMTLDKLAGMMQNEFLNLNKKLDTKVGEKEFRTEIKKIKTDIKDVRLLTQGIDRKLDAEVERHNNQDLKFKNHEERIIILEQESKVKL